MEPDHFLGALRRRLRGVLVADAASRLVVLGLLSLLALGLLDWVCASGEITGYVPGFLKVFIKPLPGTLRLVLVLVWVAVVLVLLHRRAIRPLGLRMTREKLAALTERRVPGLDGRLFSALDGIPLGEADRGALREELNPGRVRELVPGRGLGQRLSAACCVGLVAIAMAWYFPQHLATGLQRLFLPLGDASWPKTTELDGRLDRFVVPTDQPLVVELGLRGNPAPVTLSWDDERGFGDARLLDSTTGPWREALDLPPGRYRLVASAREQADPIRLTGRVVERPDIASLRATLVPPAYLGDRAEPEILPTLAATGVLPGTRFDFALDLALDPERDADQVAMRFAGAEIPFERDGDRLTGSFMILEEGDLVVDMSASYRAGDRTYRVRPKPEERFRIETGEDARPTVRLTGPARNEAVTPQAEVGLRIEAGDDHGIASLRLLHQVYAEEAERSQEHAELRRFADVEGLDQVRRKHLLVVGEHAESGEVIELIGEAADANDVTGPGIGTSDPLRLRVVGEDVLAQELDRILHDARERLAQARSQLAPGLADAERLKEDARRSRGSARRAGEYLREVARRWRDNKLDPERRKAIDQAADLVNQGAMGKLDEAAEGGEEGQAPARAADAELGKAERLLARMLRSDDLVRELRTLLKRQRALNEESRKFVLEHLTGTLDEAARVHRSSLADRQTEIGESLKKWEGRLLGTDSQHLERARETVRREQPADRLDQAAERLAGDRARQQAVEVQVAATETMKRLLELLKGEEDAKDRAAKIGEIAAAQEALKARLEDGEAPESMEEEQKRLRDQVEELLEEMDQENPETEKAHRAMAGAAKAQESAEGNMSKGNSSGSKRDAGTAASLLRKAQRELDPEKAKGEQGEDEEKHNSDVIRLLRELRDMQIEIVAGVIELDRKMVEERTEKGRPVDDPELDFVEKRRLAPYTQSEVDVRLRLQEEGIAELEKHPIAKRALQRLDTYLGRAVEHLETPALGARGVRLTQVVLYEIERLLEIVENMPPPKKDQKQREGDGGGGQQNQAPFPERAQLALLKGEQERLRRLAASNLPGDHFESQEELAGMVAFLLERTKPGSLPDVLLQRALRAMASAAYELGMDRRGTVARNEMDAAALALQRLLEEQKAGNQGGQGAKQQQSKQQQKGRSKSQKGDGKGKPERGKSAGATQGGNATGNQGGPGDNEGTREAETGAEEPGRFLHLPPRARERLLEARKAGIPPGAEKLFQTYLELLEDLD